MTSLTIALSWEACHRLVNVRSNNSHHFHGHSYKALATIEAPVVVQKDNQGSSALVGAQLQAWVIANWDHASLLAPDDKQGQRFCEEAATRFYICVGNPTVEVLAKELFGKAQELTGDGACKVVRVEVTAASARGVYEGAATC